jgi:hypothetical protein
MSNSSAGSMGAAGWYRRYPAALIIALAVIFYLLTIRPGHDWGGDFGLYIAHAKNIATGHAYSDTGFVYNPYEPFLSPRSYPPVFPVVLAPVYAAFGLNLYAMKVADILVFGVFLLLFYRYTEKRIDSMSARLVLLAMVAFSPWFWDAKDSILPDYVFLLVLFAIFHYVDRSFDANSSGSSTLLIGIMTGVLLYLAYATRSVALIMAPTVFLLDLLRLRTVRRSTLLAIVVFACAYLAQFAWLHNDTSYLDSIRSVADEAQVTLQSGTGSAPAAPEAGTRACGKLCALARELADRIPGKTMFYAQEVDSYWENGRSLLLSRVLSLCVGVLALTGFIRQLRRSLSLGDLFCLCYVTVLLVVPFMQSRYLLPLVPLYLLYAVSGVEAVTSGSLFSSAVRTGARGLVMAVFAVVVALSHAGKYSTYDTRDMQHGVESSDSRELFEYLKHDTPRDSLLVFYRPRPLALFSERKAVKYHWELDPGRLWNYLTGIGATHMIVPKFIPVSRHDRHYMNMIEHYRDHLDVVFENRDYRVYRVIAR